MTEGTIVIAIVLAALIGGVWSIWKKLSGKGCGCCGGCDSSPPKHVR